MGTFVERFKADHPEEWAAAEIRYETAKVAARVANDNGARHELDDVIAAFGYTRDELEAGDQ